MPSSWRGASRGVIIINVARGGLLDYGATRSGASSPGAIGGMGLDVQWDEPMDPEDAVCSSTRACTVRPTWRG